MADTEESLMWSPTMNLRWVNSEKADKETNAVKFSNDIGWGWPNDVVLQQMWQGNKGHQKWVDVPLELKV